MAYKVAIRKNDTGEIRLYQIAWDWFRDGGDGDTYWWTEGNYSCDCNRELCWRRSGGEDPSIEDVHCGDDRFSALYAELPDATRIFLDEEKGRSHDDR